MARIALTVAGAVVGGIVGGVIHPVKTFSPRLSDLSISTSANGTIVPFGYGSFRVGGQVIWSAGLVVNEQNQSAKGGPVTVLYNYYANFAAAFCQGPASIVRIWGDTKIIYEAGGPSYYPSRWFAPGSAPGWLCGVCGAFIDEEGNVLEAFWVGHGTTLTVPSPSPAISGSITLQLGINGNYQAITSGGFNFNCSVDGGSPSTVYVPSTALPWEVTATENAEYPFGNVGGTAPVVVFQNLEPGQTISIQAMLNPGEQGDGTNFQNNQGKYWGQITPDNTVATTAEGYSTGKKIQWYGPDGDTHVETDDIESAPPSSIYPQPECFMGTQDQEPAAWIQAHEGIENTPGFRGLCYAVWENFPVANFNNRLPYIRAQVSFGGAITTTPVPNVVQSKNATGENGSITVTLDQPPAPNNTLIAICTFVAPVAYLGAIPEEFSEKYVLVKGGSANNGGGVIIAAAGVNIVGNQTSWTFPCAAFPYPYNYGGYGGVCCTIIEILGTPTVIAATGAAGEGSRPYGTTSVVGGSLDVSGPSLAISGFTAYFDGGIVAESYSPAAFNSPTITFAVVYNGMLSLRGVAGSDPISGKITAQIHCAATGSGTYPINWYTIEAQFPNQGKTQTLTGDLAAAVLDICKRSGLKAAQVDVTRLSAKQVLGYVVGRTCTGAEALQPLTKAFFFDAAEINTLLVFIPRGQTSMLTIPENDLGLLEDHAEYTESMGQEQDLPREIQVIYADPALNYQQGKQAKRRSVKVVKTRNAKIIEFPIAFDGNTAAQIAEKTLYLAYLERRSFKLNLWKAIYRILTPTDIITFVGRGVAQQVRVLETSEGAGGAMGLKAVSEQPSAYLSTIQGGTNQAAGGGHAPSLAAITLYLFDIPLLRDADANPNGSGYYYAIACAADWAGAILDTSTDDSNFAQESTDSTRAIYGFALNVLGAEGEGSPAGEFSPWVVDTVNRLSFNLSTGSLANATLAQLTQEGENALLVGSEVIQFETALQNEDGSWTVSNLLRGRRGSESFCATHTAGPGSPPTGELVVVLNPLGMIRVARPNTILGVERYYRAVPNGQTLDAVASQAFTITGNDIKPYSPVAIGGSVDDSGDWIISWLRRSRYGGNYGTGNQALIDGVGGPVNEQSESYELDIFGGSPDALKRTISTTISTAIYTQAQQIADFGAPQNALTVKVYQISAVVGRGWPGEGSLPASTDAPVMSGGAGQFYINGG